MKTKKLLLLVLSAFLILPFVVNAQSELISRIPQGGTSKVGIGKQIVSIHSYSSQTKNEEGPINLLLPDASANEDKWCDNTTPQPWVIFELSNYYNVDKFVITDARIREQNNGNIAEYKIFVTNTPYSELINGWDDADWEEVYHGVDEGALTTKEAVLDAAKKARYVKFLVLDKGVRFDNLNPENAVRVYGFDIYGTFAENVDRGNLISVGKSILGFENAVNKRETALNVIDGNLININNKWCYGNYGTDIKQRYVIIDLEAQYDISQIKIYDALFLEPNTINTQGVNIYVSKYAPDMSLINMYGDDPNTVWTKVIDSNFEHGDDIKIYPNADFPFLTTSVSGRFVKVEIPFDKAGDVTQATRIYQVEVYGTDAVIDDNDATLSLLTVSEGTLQPAFSGDITNYTVDLDKEIESVVIAASPTNRDATVTSAGLKVLDLGENNYAITVTSKNNLQTKTYNVTVNRATQSKIATLQSLSGSVGFFSPTFNPDSTNYFLDVPFGTASVDILALATQENATIAGTGTKTINGTADQTFSIVVTAEDGVATKTYKLTVASQPENLISVNFGLPTGKRVVNIHSYSAKADDNESAYKLLIGERLNTNGNTGNKWCDNSSSEPWVIFSLTDIYRVSRIVIRDGKLMESSNSNVANISGVQIEMSTTGVNAEDFEIVDMFYSNGENIIDINYLADNARYIKLTFEKGYKDDGGLAGAVWIYGVDIYGTKSQDVDRGRIVSVGKTIVSRSSNYSDRETPCNLLDGNISYQKENFETGEYETVNSDPWAFSVNNGDGYVVIDLENEYFIDSLKLYDTNDWIKGYKVLVNTTGNEADWAEVFSGLFDPEIEEYEDENLELKEKTVGPDPKVAKLDTRAKARFIKLSIPVEMQSDEWNRIREFEVYGELNTNSLDLVKSNATNLVIYPNPVAKGGSVYLNEKGLVSIYSLQGNLVLEKNVSGATHISLDNIIQGSYIIRLSNESGVKQAKLIVK